jgi:hypothetical protein
MTNKAWWKECVAYQIYPRDVYDSNGMKRVGIDSTEK